jgi:hypothetical protein
MFVSVSNNPNFEFMIDLIDIIFHPFLAFGFNFFVGIKFHFIFASVYKLLLYIILLRKLVIPKLAPYCTNISNHRKII